MSLVVLVIGLKVKWWLRTLDDDRDDTMLQGDTSRPARFDEWSVLLGCCHGLPTIHLETDYRVVNGDITCRFVHRAVSKQKEKSPSGHTVW